MSALPLDETIKHLRYQTVTKGTQFLINFEGTDSLMVLVCPADGRKPYFYYRDRDFEDYIEMGGKDAIYPD